MRLGVEPVSIKRGVPDVLAKAQTELVTRCWNDVQQVFLALLPTSRRSFRTFSLARR